MARQTTNYGLTKPDYTDIADIEVVNANMDIIDGALKVIDTKSNNVMSKNSSAWSSTVAYAVGQYCIYNNSLWKCLVQHSGQTPQEGTYWARVSLDTLGSEINALNSNLGKSGTRKKLYSSVVGITQGTTITLNDKLSNFKFICIEVLVSETNVMAILQIDVDGFKKSPRTFSTSQSSVTTPATHYMSSSLKYVDDTHVIITGWGSGWTINYVNVYGIY